MTKPFRIGLVGAASSFTFIFADALKEEAPADIEFAGMTYLDREERYIQDSTNLPWLTKYPKTIAGYVQTYGVPAYETFEELVEQGRPDGVCICTEDYLHLHYALKALEAGLHVYVPKPFASQHDEAAQMFEAAQQRGKALVGSLPWRYHPTYLKANQLIEQGAIGKPLSGHMVIDHHLTLGGWKSDPTMASGPEFEMGYYVFDAMRWLMKSEPRRVMAYAANLDHQGIPFIDNAVCLVEFQNGSMGTIDLRFSPDFRCHGHPPADILGDEGALIWEAAPNGSSKNLLVYNKAGMQRHEPDPFFNYKGGEMLQWAECAREGKDVSGWQQECLRTLDFIAAFKLAHQTRQPVEMG